jgi:hypothetical protein
MNVRGWFDRRGAHMISICLVVSSSAAWPSVAAAQAAVTPAGEGTIGILHQYVSSDTHLNRTGRHDTLGTEAFHVVSIEGSYGLRDRLAIEGSILWTATQWAGPIALRHGPLDTGIFHGAFQDLRVAARYQVTNGRTAVTTFAGVVVPTHAYETRGHSAFGRRLRELELGISAGRAVPWLPGHGYVYGSGAYAFSQRVEGSDFNLNHANGDFEVGTSLGRIGVRGFGNWQKMWDGLQVGPIDEHFDHLRPIHDRLAWSSYVKLGAGADIRVASRTTLSVNGYATAYGRNIHAVRAIVTGITWDLGGGFKVVPE